jgi:GNAT superfamily N-acetyltransferase
MPFLEKRDWLQVGLLHRRSIRTGFLSTLGEGFLSRLYGAIASHPGSCVIVERGGDGAVLGFVSGALSVRACYAWVLRRHFLSLGFRLVPRLFSLKRMIETLRYGKGAGPELPELLSMAVSEQARGKGIGKRLVLLLEQWFIQKGVTGEYRVVTYALDPQSNAFYRNAGFSFHHEFLLHGNRMNEYRKRIGR